MKSLVSVITLVLLLYLIAALGLYLLQRKFIYYPSPAIEHGFTERNVEARDGTNLKLIVVNAGMSDAVIYFGGNAEIVAASASDMASALPDKTIYLANYRGYGGSAGQPTQENLFSDAEVIFDTVSANHDATAVVGRSLGSGVACWLATQRSVVKMVLITPYDSILDIARASYRIFPVKWLLKDQYRSIDYAPLIDVPVLAILAERDRVIPTENSQRLLKTFAGGTKVTMLSNRGHNDLQLDAGFYAAISGFLLNMSLHYF